MIDFTEDKESTSNEALAKAEGIATVITKLQAEIKSDEEIVKKKKADLAMLETITLPEYMKEVGLEKFTTSQGASISIKAILRGSLPSQGAINKATGDARQALQTRSDDALEYLREHGAAALIKSVVSVDLGKGEEMKESAIEALTSLGLSPVAVETVHPMSLSSWLKEMLEGGSDVPFDTFNIFSGDKAIVKLPKK